MVAQLTHELYSFDTELRLVSFTHPDARHHTLDDAHPTR